jgi:hypothetical protein
MEIELHELKTLLQDAAEMGAKKALSEIGLAKTYLNKAECYRMYGRRNVDKWIEQGTLRPVKQGKSSRYNRSEIEAISKSNRIQY